MSLLKKRVSKVKPGDFEDRGDNVTYSSVNDAEQKAFAAVTPVNSHHAARLAQIAMAVQENQPKGNGHNKTKKPSRLLGPSTSHRGQIQYHPEYPAPNSVPPEAVRQQAQADDYGDYRGPYEQGMSGSYATDSAPQQNQVAASSSGPVHSEQAPRVTRRRTDERTGYLVRSSNGGKVSVSAPSGSNEAQFFDSVAETFSKPQEKVCQDYISHFASIPSC